MLDQRLDIRTLCLEFARRARRDDLETARDRLFKGGLCSLRRTAGNGGSSITRIEAPRQTVSACVIARGEEARLPECARSVATCEQVMVVDSVSRDRAVALALTTRATVVLNRWPGRLL